MSPLEPSYATRVGAEYSSILEAQEKDLKSNYVKMIEVYKEEMNKSLKKLRKTQRNNWKK